MFATSIFSRVAAVALVSIPLAAAAQTKAPEIYGRWSNPSGSVQVETANCGSKLCGKVVWATPEAIADARDGGTPNLVGTTIMQDYHETAPGQWQGHVFVPDMNGSYFSRIVQIDHNSIKVSGCIFGGLLCKSQVWHRI